MAPEFNLLDEPWIRVLKKDCSEQEVSITEALIHAHEYLDLSGDMPEQDMAVLRLLLAVLHTVFSRVDENGQADRVITANHSSTSAMHFIRFTCCCLWQC